MPIKADALYVTLQSDLQDHLDDYQFRYTRAGGSFWPDAGPSQVAAVALVSKILSKYSSDGKPSRVACKAAQDKMEAVNKRCLDFELIPQDYRDEVLLGLLKDELKEFFNPCGDPLIGSISQIMALGGVGKGSSVKARGCDLYTKLFDSPLSFTKDDLLFSWEHTVSQDDRWFAALYSLYQAGHMPVPVAGNVLSFVSKNDAVARCTCTEPTINMWGQLGIGALITARLNSHFGIRLSTQQDYNREMARLASEGADFCTIDLESASDSISLRLLDQILDRDVMTYLRLFRSEVTTLPDGRVLPLGMVSTMGNGFTFPLQTAIFSAVIASVYKFLGIPLIKRGDAQVRSFATFGDDMICRKGAYAQVVRLLQLCGFRVNASKSFSEGAFYESCGADWFSGSPVRPFYIKQLRTDEDLFKAINGLNRWSAVTGIRLTETVSELYRHLSAVYLVPPYCADDAGIHVPLDKAGVKYVYPGTAQYYERVPCSYTIYVASNGHYNKVVCGENVKEKRGFNPSGLVLSFLHGSLKGYRISLRQDEVRYTTKPRVSSSWNNLGPECLRLGVDWPRWSSAAENNLSVVFS